VGEVEKRLAMGWSRHSYREKDDSKEKEVVDREVGWRGVAYEKED